MMWKTFSLHVTPYCWENVKEQGREYGPLELTNKALCPYLYHVKIPPLLPEAAVEEDKMLDDAGQRRIGFCFLSFSSIQSGSVPIDAALPGSSVAVRSWSHVSRALNTNADASYSFKDVSWTGSATAHIQRRPHLPTWTVVRRARSPFGCQSCRREQERWANYLLLRRCAWDAPWFYQPFCLPLFLSRSIFYKTHTSFCIKQELSITQPPFCFFFFFFHGGLNAWTTKLSSPLAITKSRDMGNQMKLCSNLQGLVVLCLAHLHLSDMVLW